MLIVGQRLLSPGDFVQAAHQGVGLWPSPTWEASGAEDPVVELSASDLLLVISVQSKVRDRAAYVVSAQTGQIGFVDLEFVASVD